MKLLTSQSGFTHLLGAIFLCAALRSGAQQSSSPVRPIDPGREFSAEQILNGTLPGRQSSPPPADVHEDASGFARERLYHLPAPGVHPRIYFGPEDLPAIRKRLGETSSGRQMLAYTRKQIAAGLDKPGTWENQLFRYLEQGKLEDFAKLYKPEESAYVAGNSPPSTILRASTRWHHRDSFGLEVELKAFLCLLDDNAVEGARLGRVLEQYATYYKPRVEEAAAGPFGDNWWRSMRSAVEGWPFLPLAYDLDYKFMTEQQRARTRSVLAEITAGRYTLGMELPPHWRVWNFIGLSLYEAIFALAIEGEPGYDPRIYKRSVEVARDYLAYGVNPTGMAHESIGYHSAGLSHLSEVMLAMAIRGDNLFVLNHYREQFDQWFVQSLQPYGRQWFSDGDLGNFPAATEPVMAAKYFYPHDAKLDYVFQNTPEVQKNNFGTDLYMLEAMLTASDPDRDANGKLKDYQAGAELGLPETYTDPARGVVMTRDRWTHDAMYLNFECHPDTVFSSHDHADRGRFVLSALGRNWAWQDSRPHETSQTNSVIIDDQGQGYFTPYAKYLGMHDTAQATFASCDAKYAYDWSWPKESGMWADDDPRLKTPFYSSLRSHVPKLDPAEVEYDPTPQVRAFYEGYLAGSPKIWDEDSWVVRQANNPVRFAFRSAGLVRGEKPYAVVVDDLRKDEAMHTYKWVMQLEEDLVLEQQSRHDGVHDIVLAETKGDRRLLVRVLEDGEPGADAFTEHYDTSYQVQGKAAQHVIMYRLTLPVRGREFRGKILLYAFHKGEALPSVSWDAKRGEGRFGTDELLFTLGKDDRTRLTVRRRGKTLAQTP